MICVLNCIVFGVVLFGGYNDVIVVVYNMYVVLKINCWVKCLLVGK